MDVISLLPLEVSRYIFEFLGVTDLGRCLQVSKTWRNISNDNLLWMKHCKEYDILEISPSKPIYGKHISHIYLY